MKTKICKMCNSSYGLDEFYNKKEASDGKHIYCKTCMKQEKKQYYAETKHVRADYYKTYRDQNKEYFNQYSNIHYHTKKELYREWNKNRYHSDPAFRVKHVTAARISQALKTYQTLKKDRTIEYLGCTMDEYTYYLEQMLHPGDPSGSAGDVINCRCTLGYEAVRGTDGKPKRLQDNPPMGDMGLVWNLINNGSLCKGRKRCGDTSHCCRF